MNDETGRRERDRTRVSVPLLVASVTLGVGACWLVLSTPVLSTMVEMFLRPIDTQAPTSGNVELVPSIVVSFLVPTVLIVVGVFLVTRSLAAPPVGLAFNRNGIWIGILSGVCVVVGCWAAFVSCLEIASTFEGLGKFGTEDALRGPDDQPIPVGTIGLSLRAAAGGLSFAPQMFLYASITLFSVSMFGFSDSSTQSLRPKRKVVILSLVIAVLSLVVCLLQLRDIFAFFDMTASKETGPSDLAEVFSGSLNKTFLGYVMLAGQGVLLSVVAFCNGGHEVRERTTGERKRECVLGALIVIGFIVAMAVAVWLVGAGDPEPYTGI